MKFKNNPNLKNNYPPNFEGTPIDDKGRFKNLGIHYIPGFKDAMKWQFTKNPMKSEKKSNTWKPEVIIGNKFLSEEKNNLVWLGHASFYLQLNGKQILIDPVLENVSLLKRQIPAPCPTQEFKNIDYLFISHNHRDHCDEKTLKIIASTSPNIKIFTGLNVEKTLVKWFPKSEIQSAGWFQDFNMADSDFKLTYVPARHWSKRWLNDDNTSLWGGFVLQHAGKTIYFMGDSGYGDHFKMIGNLFNAPDFCLMGIGAFMPEWFMGPSHISPTNAVRAFNELKGKKLIPMHHGTFDLSDEPLNEPIRQIKELKQQNTINGELLLPKIGETIYI